MAMASEITLKQLQDFHNIDRQAYSRLVLSLGFEIIPSMKIVGFWNSLERRGSKNFVKNLQFLSDPLLLSLAKEAMKFLECLYLPAQEISQRRLPVTKKIVGQEILLADLLSHRECTKRMIEDFVEHVCRVAFCDIVMTRLAREKSSKSSHGGETKQEKARVGSEDRTLFMTFSRGQPVFNQDLHGFVARNYGDCVEAIYMDRRELPLFACVVLKSISDLSRILGGKKMVEFFINGKQVRARRFVSKSSKLSQCTTAAAAAAARTTLTGFPNRRVSSFC